MLREYVFDQLAHEAAAIAVGKGDEIVQSVAAASTIWPKLSPPSWQGFWRGR
jgi:hypothetical protein